MRDDIPGEQARRDSTLVSPSASTGPLKNMEVLFLVAERDARRKMVLL
jgi:hypothetical protein